MVYHLLFVMKADNNIAAIPKAKQINAQRINAVSPISNNNHVPARKNTAVMIGNAHSVRKSFPALIPEVIAQMGFSAKNNMKQAAIPPSPFMNVTASHGNANMTADDAIFTMYVLCDPTYDGATTLFSQPIEGIEAYRSGMEIRYNLILADGNDGYTANDFYTEEQYEVLEAMTGIYVK